jgi:type IV secretory pathway VirB2 component (pilin)
MRILTIVIHDHFLMRVVALSTQASRATLLAAAREQIATSIPWIMELNGNSMILRGNATICAAILRVVQVGTPLNSASTGTSEYYAY